MNAPEERADQIPVHFFLTAKSEATQKLHATLGSFPDLHLQVHQQADTLIAALKEYPFGLLMYGVPDDAAFIECLKVFQVIQPYLKKGHVRAIGYSTVDVDSVLPAFLRFGVAECIEEAKWPKQAAFKAERTLSLLRNSHKEFLSTHRNVELGSQRVVLESAFKDSKCDCWLLPAGETARFNKDVWSIPYLGPPAALGNWIQKVDDRSTKLDFWWTWVFLKKSAEGLVQSETGRWQFYGRKPEFNRETGVWTFSSPAPSFVFVTKDGVVDYKLKTDTSTINIRANTAREAELRAKLLDLLHHEPAAPASAVRVIEPAVSKTEPTSWKTLLQGTPIRLQLFLTDDQGTILAIDEPRVVDLFENELSVQVSGMPNPLPKYSKTNCVFHLEQGAEVKVHETLAEMVRIEKLKSADENTTVIELKLESLPKEFLDELNRVLSERQENVKKFLKLAKG